MLKKRGQITIFIIIGIFILVLSSLFLYLRQDRSSLIPSQKIPEEIIPVKSYVEECMQMYAERGILLMGTQGGYIDLPPMIDHNPYAYIAAVPNGNIKVPYWYYEGNSMAPTIQDMEKEISRYMDTNLKDCLNSFKPFKEKFDIVEAGNISTKTTIAEENVFMTTTYPLEVKPKGTSQATKLVIYDAAVPVRLKRIYKLAAEILTAENRGMFLENATINLMTLGPDIPFTDIVFTCKKLRWYKSDVEAGIKNLLYYNLPRIRFEDTRHEPFLSSVSDYERFRYLTPEDVQAGQYPKDSPADLYDYYHLYWDASGSSYPDLQANIYYQKDWRFDLNVRPSNGEMMDSSMGRGMEKYLRFLCINIYHFTYDLIFPVEVVIRDDSAFNGKGFYFSYAIPVMINHNQGQREPFGISVFETPRMNTDYCSDLREDQVRIYAKDKHSFEDIKDVNLTFNCMNTYYCDLGKTIRESGVYRLKSSLPSFCRPGSIDAVKEGYLKASETVPSTDFMDIYMTPVKKMNFKVVKRRLTVNEFQPYEILDKDETAVIYITTKNATDYDVYNQYPLDEETPEELRRVDVIEDDIIYNLDIVLMKGDRFIGGYRGEWKASYDDVLNSNEVNFVVMEKIPHPVTEEEEAQLMLDLQNKDYLQYLQPVLR